MDDLSVGQEVICLYHFDGHNEAWEKLNGKFGVIVGKFGNNYQVNFGDAWAGLPIMERKSLHPVEGRLKKWLKNRIDSPQDS